jgi:uncharacterized BrkB/YihY/UPF0761 family membrane protein
MPNNAPNTTAGIGFMSALALLFITLKLTDTISWSWWWVLAPIWGVYALAIATFLTILLVWAIYDILHRNRR